MTHYYPVKEAGFVFTDEVVATINLIRFRKSNDSLGKIMEKFPFSNTEKFQTFLMLARERRLPDAFYDLSPVLEIDKSIQAKEEFEGFFSTFDITLAQDEGDVFSEEQVTYICYLPMDYEPSYLDGDAPYQLSDDMLKELKEKLSGYLPEEFDFGKFFCSISGVYLS